MFHRHKWIFAAAKEVEAGGMVGAMTGPRPETWLLYRCAGCPTLKSEMVTGPFERELTALQPSLSGSDPD